MAGPRRVLMTDGEAVGAGWLDRDAALSSMMRTRLQMGNKTCTGSLQLPAGPRHPLLTIIAAPLPQSLGAARTLAVLPMLFRRNGGTDKHAPTRLKSAATEARGQEMRTRCSRTAAKLKIPSASSQDARPAQPEPAEPR